MLLLLFLSFFQPTPKRQGLSCFTPANFTLPHPCGFPGGSVVKNLCRVGDMGSIPGSGGSPRVGNGNPL